MITKKIFYGAVVALVLVTGCGNNEKKELGGVEPIDEGRATVVTPNVYTHKVINNKGEAVNSRLGALTIQLYSDVQDQADPKSLHKGVVVNINGEDSQTMPIQASYLGDDIVVAIYNERGDLITTTEAVEVTDDTPVVLVNVTI